MKDNVIKFTAEESIEETSKGHVKTLVTSDHDVRLEEPRNQSSLTQPEYSSKRRGKEDPLDDREGNQPGSEVRILRVSPALTPIRLSTDDRVGGHRCEEPGLRRHIRDELLYEAAVDLGVHIFAANLIGELLRSIRGACTYIIICTP